MYWTATLFFCRPATTTTTTTTVVHHIGCGLLPLFTPWHLSYNRYFWFWNGTNADQFCGTHGRSTTRFVQHLTDGGETLLLLLLWWWLRTIVDLPDLKRCLF